MNPFLTDVIGSNVTILKHPNPSMVGVKGIVVDERKNVIVIDSEGNEKTIPKVKAVADLNGTVVSLDEIRFRPEEKMKKMRERKSR